MSGPRPCEHHYLLGFIGAVPGCPDCEAIDAARTAAPPVEPSSTNAPYCTKHPGQPPHWHMTDPMHGLVPPSPDPVAGLREADVTKVCDLLWAHGVYMKDSQPLAREIVAALLGSPKPGPWQGGMPLVPTWCIDHAESEVIWQGHHIPIASDKPGLDAEFGLALEAEWYNGNLDEKAYRRLARAAKVVIYPTAARIRERET